MNIFAPCDLPTINGDLVSLRPITWDDTDYIVTWRNKPSVYRHFIFRQPFTREMHENWLRTKVETGKVIQYIILDKFNRKPIGSVYYRDVDPDNESAEYGIFIGEEDYLGRGFGTETARLFTAFGLDVLKLHRISLRVLGGNDIAKHSYENAGFTVEGEFRDMVKLDGEFRDVIFMSIISEE
jgi:RimJ/RimL family protein N-acetyltransferase